MPILDGSGLDDRERARALLMTGNHALQRSEYAAARADFEAALLAARSAGDQSLIVKAGFGLGVVALQHDDVATARPYFEAGLAHGRENGDEKLVASSLTTLAGVAQRESAWAEARQLCEEALMIHRRLGDTDGIGLNLGHLGTVALGEGNALAARGSYLEALAYARSLGDECRIGYWLFRLGVVAAVRGEPETAARLAGAGEAAYASVGVMDPPVAAVLYEPHGEALRRELGEAGFDALVAEGRALTLEEAVRLAEGGEGLGPDA
jgi:tetratricopeptide (TPR) repeat protein